MRRDLLGVALVVTSVVVGCASTVERGESPSGVLDHRMDWWREARFGLFIHWGLYSIPAGEWKGETDHGEWIMTTAHIPIREYETLRASFDPVLFDADAWAALAAEAGMKYVVITSKHHDGFCLFDSKLTDYDVMSTPFRRDILAELAAACRKHGLRMCWYHSIMDWRHPDYVSSLSATSGAAESARFARYVEHLHGQVEELLTSYGPIGVMWFDGEWEPSWTNDLGKELNAHCRRLQPDVIVNNRVSTGRGGMAGMTAEGDFPGDFGTPEQEIPSLGLPGVDWETCMTMNDHWGYNRHDDNWKSSADLVRKLVDIASKGGNFLLNVGPTAEGLIPPVSVERLRFIGAWLATNGDSIYGTSAGPFASLAWGRCTMRREDELTKLYLHVFDWPESGELVVEGLANEILGARLLARPDEQLATSVSDAALAIRVPSAAPDPTVSVIEIVVRGELQVFEPPAIESASDSFVRSLSIALSTQAPGVEIRYTLDGTTPASTAKLYSAPFSITETTTVRARSFARGRAVSGVGDARLQEVAPRAAADVEGAKPGLVCERFFGVWDRMPSFDPLRCIGSERVADVTVSKDPRSQYVARRYQGFVRVPEDDVYVFALESDDGSRLWIDGELVVDNDGLHVASLERGTIPLARGAHAIRIEYFNKRGGAHLELEMARLGDELQPVPSSALSSP